MTDYLVARLRCPAGLAVSRRAGSRGTVDAKALVHFEGNRYSVLPELLGQTVAVRDRLGELDVEILSAAGRKVARHRRAPAGAAQTIRDAAHAHALERGVLDAFSSSPPCSARRTARPVRSAPT